MEALLEKAIGGLILDRSDWKIVKFGDVAIQKKKTVDREDTDITRYVKGEHMYTNDLRLRKWGELKDEYLGPAFIRKFEKGDILYGSRRTYLRKVVIAPFKGITSNTTYVMKANEEIIDIKLLPFIMLSEGFSQHSIRNSKGSVNPYVNWKDISGYEFLLPPLSEQKALGDLLLSINDEIESKKNLLIQAKLSLNSYIKQVINSHIIESKFKNMEVKSPFQTRWETQVVPETWKNLMLKDVIEDVQNGFAEGKRDKSGIKQLRMNNVSREGQIDLSKIALIPNRGNISRYLIELGDVMFCNTNSEDLVGKSIIADDSIAGFAFSNHFTRLRPRSNLLLGKFLYIWLKYHFDLGLFERRCTRWIGQAAVQSDSLLRLYIKLPPLEEQELASLTVIKIENRIAKIRQSILSSEQLQKSLINGIF